MQHPPGEIGGGRRICFLLMTNLENSKTKMREKVNIAYVDVQIQYCLSISVLYIQRGYINLFHFIKVFPEPVIDERICSRAFLWLNLNTRQGTMSTYY